MRPLLAKDKYHPSNLPILYTLSPLCVANRITLSKSSLLITNSLFSVSPLQIDLSSCILSRCFSEASQCVVNQAYLAL
ncbi:hypothetical protein FGO68_gene4126 [Halteria grandinella]|uniref:Uncharacterized protein n=1 Tax=Halteria grandinella TaxID=5974 RepID=A0A8J8NLC1_HALGN|nr:hypothetical protein FGO68_gene4126 [Halteria grandinella]